MADIYFDDIVKDGSEGNGSGEVYFDDIARKNVLQSKSSPIKPTTTLEKLEQKFVIPKPKEPSAEAVASSLYKEPMFLLNPVMAIAPNKEQNEYSYMNYVMEHNEDNAPTFSKDWATGNLSKSTFKLPGRIYEYMFHGYPKAMVDEFSNYARMKQSEEYKKLSTLSKLDVESGHLGRQLDNVAAPITGLIDGFIKGLGVFDAVNETINGKTIFIDTDEKGNKKVAFALPEFKEMREMWNKDPVGTASLYVPFAAHAYFRKLAKTAKTEQAKKMYNILAEKELAKAREAKATEPSRTKLKTDVVKQQYNVAKEAGFLDPDYIENTWNNLLGIGDIYKADASVPSGEIITKGRKKKAAEIKEKRITTKQKKAAEAVGVTGVKTTKDVQKKLEAEVEAAKTPEEVVEVKKKYEGVADPEVLGSIDENTFGENLIKEEGPELNAASVEDLDVPGYQVIYDAFIEDRGTHQLTLVPEGMSFEEVLKSGKATSLEVSGWNDAKTKIGAKVKEYEKVDDIKNHGVDEATGLNAAKPERKLKPIKNPEEHEFFESKERAIEQSDTIEGIKDQMYEDPDLYLSFLVNEVNKWYHGIGDVDISAVRSKLSDLATKVDDLKEDFLRPADLEMPEEFSGAGDKTPYDAVSRFDDYKLSTRQASQWAKRLQKKNSISETADRSLNPITEEEAKLNIDKADPEPVEYGTVADIRFFTGIPVDKLGSLFSVLRKYAHPIVEASDNVKRISLVGSSTKGMKGKDVDLLYDLGNISLSKDTAKACSEVQDLIESTNGIDLDKYDTHIKAGDRYFHVQSGAGREIVENTEYGRKQKGKPVIVLTSKSMPAKTVKLYSGVDPTELFKKPNEWFKKVWAAKDENLKVEKQGRFNRLRRSFDRNFFSQSANFKRDVEQGYMERGGSEVLQSTNLSISATSKSASIAQRLRDEITEGLTSDEIRTLNDVIFAKRTRTIIDRDNLMKMKDKKYKTHKHPENMGRDFWQAFIDNIGERGHAPDRVAEIYRRADMVFEGLRDQLKQLHDEGIITTEVYEDLKDLDYTRRQVIDIIDPEVTGIGNSKTRVRESGIQELRVGDPKQLLETDSLRLMEDVIIRTQNRIMANKAALDLKNLAELNPDNPIVRIKGPDIWRLGKEEINLKGDSLHGWERIPYYVEGKQEFLRMNPEYAKEWLNKNKEVSYEFGKFARLVSGSSILKAMATGVNVGFAVKNIFRDFAYMWIASSHYVNGRGWTSTYSPFAPKAMAQMGKDLSEVFSDIVLRKGIYEEIVNEGVLLDFLSGKDKIMRDRIGRYGNKHWDALVDALYYASNTSELLGRASLYNRAKKKLTAIDPKRDPASIRKEAAYLARDYMFFGDYGSFSKAIGTVVPYFEATMKATEGIWRAASRNVNEFAFKATQSMIFGATMYLLNDSLGGQAYNEVNPKTRQNNIVIPWYHPFKGTDGKDKHLVPTIPKDSGQAFFMALGENAVKFMMGRDTDADAIVAGMRGLLPVQELPTVPAAEAILSYVLNKNFWTYDDIWQGEELPFNSDLSHEYNPTGKNPTNPLAVEVGKKTGLSPERLSTALGSVLPRNYMTDAFGTLTSMMYGQAPDDIKEANIAEIVGTNSTFRGMCTITDDMNAIRKDVDETTDDYIRKNIVNNNKLKVLVERGNEDEITEFIASQDSEAEVKRLEERYEQELIVKDLPHKSQFRRMDSMTPEAAANMFYLMCKNKTPEQEDKLIEEFGTYDSVSKIATDRFLDAYADIEAKEEEKKGSQKPSPLDYLRSLAR